MCLWPVRATFPIAIRHWLQLPLLLLRPGVIRLPPFKLLLLLLLPVRLPPVIITMAVNGLHSRSRSNSSSRRSTSQLKPAGHVLCWSLEPVSWAVQLPQVFITLWEKLPRGKGTPILLHATTPLKQLLLVVRRLLQPLIPRCCCTTCCCR